MSLFGSRNDPFSIRNGWINFDELFVILGNSVQKSQDKITNISNNDNTNIKMILKDIKMEIPLEVHHDISNGTTKVRLPSLSRRIDDDFQSDHLARISFSFSHTIDITSEK